MIVCEDRFPAPVTTMPLDLDLDLADLKTAAADYDARHQVIADCAWPDGARIAVNFTADFDGRWPARRAQAPRSYGPNMVARQWNYWFSTRTNAAHVRTASFRAIHSCLVARKALLASRG
jgi:hypothetical protein